MSQITWSSKTGFAKKNLLLGDFKFVLRNPQTKLCTFLDCTLCTVFTCLFTVSVLQFPGQFNFCRLFSPD